MPLDPNLLTALLDSGKGISDLVLSPGRPPQAEQYGELVEFPLPDTPVLRPADTERIALDLIGDNDYLKRR